MKKVASLNQVAIIDLADQVDASAFDNVRWSIRGNRIVNSIPLATVELVLGAIKKLHIYAAASLEHRVAMHGRRISRRARAVGDRLSLGPSVPGSYVLPVRFELGADLPTRLLTQLPTPSFAANSFEQRSMSLLIEAISSIALLVRADRSSVPETDIEVARRGVSHELVSTLVDLLRAPHVTGLSVSGTIEGSLATDDLELSTAMLPALSVLAERLYDSRLDGPDTVRGEVASLRRTGPGRGGQVRVRRTDMGDKGTVLLADLTEDDYLLAGRADAAQVEIELVGRIELVPRSLPRLVDITRILIVDDLVY